jgi:hypothetical protein
MAKPINPNLDEVSDKFQRTYADLRGALWETQRHGGTWKAVAAKAGLAESTVAKFAHGDTQKPHWSTAVRLALVCGHRLALVPDDGKLVPGEFRMSPAQRGALTRRAKKR